MQTLPVLEICTSCTHFKLYFMATEERKQIMVTYSVFIKCRHVCAGVNVGVSRRWWGWTRGSCFVTHRWLFAGYDLLKGRITPGEDCELKGREIMTGEDTLAHRQILRVKDRGHKG